MFGLENISHWQFATTLLLGLVGYYLIVLLYLALKNMHPKAPSFESEARQNRGEIKPQAIQATDFPSTPINYMEADEGELKVRMNREPDYSGYVLDALEHTLVEDKEAFLNNIEYELQNS